MTTTVQTMTIGIACLVVSTAAWAETADQAKQEMPAQKRWSTNGPGGTPGFTRHVQPLLAKTGCSGRACHGSFQGQNGFRLSLFSSDPKLDYEELVKDEKGSRVDLESPADSLILEKAIMNLDHKGGKRFEEDSWQYRMLKEWIAAGAPFEPSKEATIEKLEVAPEAKVLAKGGKKQQLKVVAHYSDATIEDVTDLTKFSTNDDAVATVTEQGQIASVKSGDTAIVASFGGAVNTSHVIVPFPGAGREFEFASLSRVDDLVAAKAGMDKFYQQAYEILSSKAAREAFDIARESNETRERYGRNPFGQACLLARRLIEAGVRFVSIDFGGWDTHQDNFKRLKDDKLPKLDSGVAGLLEDLGSHGLLDKTAVMMTGEFGRTPKVNQRGGRDHWARAMSIVMAGAGIKGGQVVGKTNDKGEEPAEFPLTPESVAASFYHALGIDSHKEYDTPTGRPVHIVRDGTVIKELFA